jgi:mycothiol synthase
MLDVSLRRPVAPGDVEMLRHLADLAESADGHPPVGDAVWRDLARPAPVSAVAIATLDGAPVGALHVGAPENDLDGSVTLALVVDPRHRDEGIDAALVAAVVEDPTLRGCRALLWVFGADERTDRFARSAGLTRARELHQLRVPLPLPADDETTWPPGIDARPFRVGRDEDAWLEVNNRAFAADPDQRGWTIETLRVREAEPWFDPAGFLVAWRGDRLAGFCWTKLHPPAPPREPATLGEIYVIGVDPAHQGIGLGRALVVGGLAHLHGRGAAVGMLFVDAANTAAMALYSALGFSTSRVDRAYVRDLA